MHYSTLHYSTPGYTCSTLPLPYTAPPLQDTNTMLHCKVICISLCIAHYALHCALLTMLCTYCALLTMHYALYNALCSAPCTTTI